MITLHHLVRSRSFRVLWLLEETGQPYDLVSYDRMADMRAPPGLAAVHPLGKAPVIVDDGLVLAESSAILRYVHARAGAAAAGLAPAPGTAEAAIHDEWLDYVESSAGLPIMMTVLGAVRGGMEEPLTSFVRQETAKTLDYIASGIGQGPFLLGDRFSLADIQMSYMLAVADRFGALDDRPAIKAYLGRLADRPGYARAVERGGAPV